MTLLLVLFGVGVVLELMPHAGGLVWRLRKVFAVISLLITAFASGALVVGWFEVWAVLIALAGMYRGINCLRFVEGRMNEPYLKQTTLRTTLVLAALQAILLLLWWGWP